MKQFIVLFVLASVVLVTLAATHVDKGTFTSAKHRKPSVPKKYIVEDTGKNRKVSLSYRFFALNVVHH